MADCRTSIEKIPKFHPNSAQFANDEDDPNGFEYVFTNIESSALQVSTFLRSDYEDAWIMDTGETQHMTFRREFFWSFQQCHLNSIYLVDKTKHNPSGKGVVKFFLPGIGERMISNVWYVPTFKKKLQSLQAGYLVIRSEERRVGKECLHQCRSRWSPYH